MARDLIGSRIKALRQARGLSQDDVARLLGFNDRQTISTIELSTRRVTAQELLLAAEKLGVPLDYFSGVGSVRLLGAVVSGRSGRTAESGRDGTQAELAVRVTDIALDRGEKSLWAHALGRTGAWLLCGPDRASLRVGVRLRFRERLVSLEDCSTEQGTDRGNR